MTTLSPAFASTRWHFPPGKWGRLVLAGILSLAVNSATAQFHVNKKDKTPYPKDKIGKIAREVRTDGWIVFKDKLSGKPKEIAAKHKDALGLGAVDELRSTEAVTDELNITRYRYTQYHGDVPVEGADFSIYAKGEQALYANGRLVQTLAAPQLAAVTEKQALATALASVPSKQYQWQNKGHEQDLRTYKRDSTATHFPKGKLLYALTTNDGNAESAVHRLAYRFDIMRLDPQAYEAVYVDALTGKLLRIASLVDHDSCQENQIDTWYNGNRRLFTWWNGSRNRFRLQDYCRGTPVLTKYHSGEGGFDFPIGVYIEAQGSEFNGLNSNWNWDFAAKSTATAHWGVQRSISYFKTQFGRNGAPGYIRDQRVLVNNLRNNAYSYEQDGRDAMTIGRWYLDDVSGRSLSELDVVAHEFTHGVVRGSARLAGGEAGALNESFSDIFGEMVELAEMGSHDWILSRNSGVRRAFAGIAPSFGTEPAQVYQGRNWDFGGQVHQNGGVQNRWFYLLSVGGTGDFSVSVNGIGEAKAASIAYRSLTRMLGPNATYANARAGSIQAAIELFGDCSPEVVATTNAWAAVGVGAAAPQFCATQISGVSDFCVENGQNVNAEYRVSTAPGATKTWGVNNGAFGFSQVGQTDYAVLSQVPGYADAAVLSVHIQFPGNPTASLWRYLNLSTIVCNPPPPDCPPGQICPFGVNGVGANSVLSSQGRPAGQSISIYPNPADTFVTLDLPTPAAAQTTITIKDMLGRTVQTQTVSLGERRVSLNVAQLPVGSYILLVGTAKGSTSQRFLVNR